MSAESIITIVLAIIAILVTLFTKALREGIIALFRKIAKFFSSRSRNILFRAVLLLLINISCLALLYQLGIIVSSELLYSFIVFSVILLLGCYIVYLPVLYELSNLKSNIRTLEMELGVLSSAKKIELESIQSRWPEFIKMLLDKPGFQTVSAFLQSSKPVYIENDVVLIGVPEMVHDVTDALNFDKITPQYQSFFGSAHKIKLIVIKQ